MVVQRCLLVLVIMGLTFLFTPTAHPATKGQIESLRGLTGVCVVVERLNNEIKKELPFDENQIRVDVELKLGMAGIKVLSEEEQHKTPGMPCLYVNLNIKHIPDMSAFYFNISLRLLQKVCLARNPDSYSLGITWQTNTMGVVGKDRVLEIRDDIKDQLDGFINDYLSVNPKGGK